MRSQLFRLFAETVGSPHRIFEMFHFTWRIAALYNGLFIAAGKLRLIAAVTCLLFCLYGFQICALFIAGRTFYGGIFTLSIRGIPKLLIIHVLISEQDLFTTC